MVVLLIPGINQVMSKEKDQGYQLLSPRVSNRHLDY